MNRAAGLLAAVFAALPMAAAREIPPELATLAAKARLGSPVAAWCRAEFRRGHPGAFAVALTQLDGVGRYLALDRDGRATELAAFTAGTPDLSCYSRREAEALDTSIQESQTIDGHVAPRWETTVVCGFVEDTTAVCWQYSPRSRSFIEVGRWTT